MSLSFLRTSGCLMICTVSRQSLSMTGLGVPCGANGPNQMAIDCASEGQLRLRKRHERHADSARDHVAYSALMLAARITLPNFSVSAAMKFPKSAGVIGIGVIPNEEKRAITFSSAR